MAEFPSLNIHLNILLNILHDETNEISKNLADIFDLPFKTGVFPDSLEIAKVIPIHQKFKAHSF